MTGLAEHGLTVVEVTEAHWPAIVGLVADLGAEGRLSRFHAGTSSLDEARARRLAAAVPGRRLGYAAATPDGRFVSHVMLSSVPGHRPEFAVMTAPAWQGRGIATALARVLAARSLASGRGVWSAEVLGGNAAAFSLLAKLGRVERRGWDGGSVHVHIHIHAHVDVHAQAAAYAHVQEPANDHARAA